MRIWCKAVTLLQHSSAWVFAVQATFQQGQLFPPQVPALGLFAVMAQLSIQKLHHSTRCTAVSQPASQPVSQSYYFGISHAAWSQYLSSLHISSAEVFAIGNDNHMQRYCRMPFFSLPPPASRVILCWSAGLKETTFCHGKQKCCSLSSAKELNIKYFLFFVFLFLLFHYLSIISVCTTCLLPLCILSFLLPSCSHHPGQRQPRHSECQPADCITLGSGAPAHPDSSG